MCFENYKWFLYKQYLEQELANFSVTTIDNNEIFIILLLEISLQKIY